MKRLLLCLALVAPLGVQAEEKDTCTLYGTLAESIMKGHQSGVPLSKALAVSETITPEIKAIVRELVINAYKEPRYATARAQQRTVDEYRDNAHLACVVAME